MARRRGFGSVRRLPSGRYQASYWWEGARHTAPLTFRAKADADAWLANAKSAIDRGLWTDPKSGRTTFRDVAEQWRAADPSKRASSASRDETILRIHVFPVLGSRPVSSITRADIQRLVNGWRTTYAPSTVGRMYSVTRAVLSYAVSSRMIGANPADDVRLPSARLVERLLLTADQLNALADALGDDMAPMMWLAVVGGLRWAEAAGLTVRCVDVLGGKVSVELQLGRDGQLGPPKSTHGIRTLAIPSWLSEALGALMARRGLTVEDADELIFTTVDNAPLDYTNWRRRVWRPACEAAGVPSLRFHDLRSQAATMLVAAGVDVRTAQTRMGHSSPQVTLAIYARTTEQADRAAADAIGKVFAPTRARSAHATPGT